MRQFLTTLDAAEYLGVSVRHIYYLIDMSFIDAVKIKTIWRFFRGELENYVKGDHYARVVGKSAGNNDRFRYGGSSFLFETDYPPRDTVRETFRAKNKKRKQLMANNTSRISAVSFRHIKRVNRCDYSGQPELGFWE